MWTTFSEVPPQRVFHLHGFMNPAPFVKCDDSWAVREGGQKISPSPTAKVWLYPEPPAKQTWAERFRDWWLSR